MIFNLKFARIHVFKISSLNSSENFQNFLWKFYIYGAKLWIENIMLEITLWLFYYTLINLCDNIGMKTIVGTYLNVGLHLAEPFRNKLYLLNYFVR